MSTAPRGGILFRYTPGVGRVAALDCCGTSGTSSPTATCATAYSTVDQTLAHGTAAVVAHDTVPFSYGITVTTGAGAKFTVPATGVYKIIPSLQYVGNNGNAALTIWLRVNGTNVADTSTYTVVKNAEEGVIVTEYLLEMNAGDNVQVCALATTQDVIVNYISGGGSGANAYPAAPGIITNMYRIR